MNLEDAEKIFLEVHEILNKFKIKVYLSDGTMLGAIRDKSFIPWDDDIDTRMAAADWNFSILKEFEKNGFQYIKYLKAKKHPELPSGIVLIKRGIKFGIGLNYYYPPEDIVVFLAGKPTTRGTLQPARFYEGNHFIDFLNIKVRIPYPPEEYLESIYGTNWRIADRDESYLKLYKTISIDKYIKYFHEHPEVNQGK